MPIKSMIIKPKRMLKLPATMEKNNQNHNSVHLHKNKLHPRGFLLLQSNLTAIRIRDLLREDTLLPIKDHHQREGLPLVGPLTIL